jgi:hypothetical protein
MSYSIAELEDGEGQNTRNEMMRRILNFFDVVADIEHNDAMTENKIRVYPNPASHQLTISNLEVDSEIQLTDLAGNVLMTRPVSSESLSLDISSLPRGLYLVRTKDGVKKVVKI